MGRPGYSDNTSFMLHRSLVVLWAVHDDDFVAIADGCPHLESVALNGATVSNTCRKSLSTVQQLRALCLFKWYVCGGEAPNGIGCLSRLTRLTSLTVADCKFELSPEKAILVGESTDEQAAQPRCRQGRASSYRAAVYGPARGRQHTRVC